MELVLSFQAIKTDRKDRKDPFHTLWCGSDRIIDVLFVLPLPVGIPSDTGGTGVQPYCAAAPAFTGDLKGDIGLSSAVNSISIIISMVMITTVPYCCTVNNMDDTRVKRS